MAWYQSTAKKTAHFINEIILYVPKGLAYSIGNGLDFMHMLLNQENITCLHHKKKYPPVKKKFSFLKIQSFFHALQAELTAFFRFFLNGLFFLVELIVPAIFLRMIATILRKLKFITDILVRNREQITCLGVLPITFLGLGLLLFGQSLIPFLYFYYVSSTWSGVLLSHTSDLIVLKSKAPAWIFLKELNRVIVGLASFKCFYQKYRDVIFSHVKLFGLHLIPIVAFGGVGRFISLCFTEFASWLALYIVTKKIAEKAPPKLIKLEKKLRRQGREAPFSSRRRNNACWMVAYDLFVRSASTKTQNHYEYLHSQLHSSSKFTLKRN